jgi:hypothetical protein
MFHYRLYIPYEVSLISNNTPMIQDIDNIRKKQVEIDEIIRLSSTMYLCSIVFYVKMLLPL